MDFAWNNQQIEFKKKVIHFAQQSLVSDLIEQDKEGIFNRDVWQKCCDFGIHGWTIPARYKEERRKPLKMWVTQEATFGL
ncbi:hypothetical protein AA650_19350 [Anabaena sp. WA102]|uniref:acyl-CoA dehydrogenase family protein n=1 Tax=Anabaena sp. WA102 TaxID=1647413 RepID=UPI0006ABF8C9|nr:acyl-CoA dehydrogenase family protein [Anabaena sp. WA102]ALB42323.1 hypothetical protein AA650_19345 [Anabaena sp. WA102]ALB42324.1 hypothetical protein AA650_19350 [Anabaena sp. WA102]